MTNNHPSEDTKYRHWLETGEYPDGIKTHSIYTHEYEGDPSMEYEAYKAIQAACIAMDELEPGDDPF